MPPALRRIHTPPHAAATEIYAMSQPESEATFGPPRGMRDFYPEDMAVRSAVFDAWTAAARRFGFERYDACVVESLDLLKRKGGEEIAEQLYTFQDKSGRDLALRAEMTPTLARMIVARQGQLTFPLKWFTIAQCFRYERMSRGRKREHFQWNLDVVGTDSLSAEIEVMAAAVSALSMLGLGAGDVFVHVSSRALLGDLLLALGIPQAHHAATFLALDKRGKIDDSAIADLLRQEGLDAGAMDAVFGLMRIASLDDAAARLGGEPASLQALRRVFDLAAAYGIADRLRFDIAVIRGLGYYTGIVFEAFDAERKFRAIFGGGRYDRLLSDIGGRPASAVGLGFGDVVVAELLAEKGRLPSARRPDLLSIGYMEDAQAEVAARVALHYRSAGRDVDLALQKEKPKTFFGRVGKASEGQAVYVGPDDVQRGRLRLKNLADRSETEIAIPASA